ncbi:MAG TPA: DUF4157 domain-containing protein [Kofleriaceae bacterium]|jgi:hypothetical protein|nr:DUF4157 domain-containing protein [Kofleriaceae bacterium]
MGGEREYRLRSGDKRRVNSERHRPSFEPEVGKRSGVDDFRVELYGIGKQTLGQARAGCHDSRDVESYVSQARAAMERLAAGNASADAHVSVASAREFVRLVDEAKKSFANGRRSPGEIEALTGSIAAVTSEAAPHLARAFTPSAQAGVRIPGMRNRAFDQEAAIWSTVDESPSALAERVTSGPCEPLPFRDRIQASFGKHDISGTRAYIGGAAGAAARKLGARAFARGDAIAFADGAVDLFTAAHEAAHVVQQRAGVALKSELDEPGDEFEQHADAVAEAVVRGEHAAPILDRMANTGATAAMRAPAVQRNTGHSTGGGSVPFGHPSYKTKVEFGSGSITGAVTLTLETDPPRFRLRKTISARSRTARRSTSETSR